MVIVGSVLLRALDAYFVVLLVRAVISWVVAAAPQMKPRGPVLVLFEVVYTLTDPPLRFLRRWVKPVRLGLASLDLAFIVLWVIVLVLERVTRAVFLS